MRLIVATVCLLAMLGVVAAQKNYVGSVGVNPRLTALANFYLNTLTTQIITYNWINCNRQNLYISITKASEYLHQIKAQLG
jgi:aspartate 1-decarboxylase